MPSEKEAPSKNHPDDSSPQGSSIPSFSNKIAADMFATYSNKNNLEFGSGGGSTRGGVVADESESGSCNVAGQEGTVTAASVAAITDGAKRLAQELDQYISKGPEKTSPHGNNADSSALSDDAIADLQLATARKLREVSSYCNLILYCLLCSYLGCSFLSRCIFLPASSQQP